MNIDINISSIYPKDNYYLQWSYIYWWQLRFNLDLSIRETINNLMRVDLE